MPGIVLFKRRWSYGSDDLVVPGTFLAVLHFVWAVILGAIFTVVNFDVTSKCTATLRQHVVGYIVIMSVCVLVEASIACLSMRGNILNTRPRRGMQYLVYVRLVVFLVEIVWLITGVVWIAQNYSTCEAPAPKKALLGIVICNWVILISVFISMWCTFDAGGRSWVKLKRYQESLKEKEGRPGHKRRSGSRRRNWRHRKAIRKYEQSWDKRCRLLFCCVGHDRHQSSFTEVARLFTEFFRDLDVVPSDIVAGLVLLRQQQKQRRKCIVQQQTNAVYQFLSGVPISPSTRFVSLSNPDELADFKRVIHFMQYALAAYGWPMYMMTHAGTGLCRIMPGLSCCNCCCCKKTDGGLEADNCCSCNLAALYKLLQLNRHQCHVVYCTYHVDIGETPFFVALDHEHRRVVVAIRGTLSLQDVLTDLKAESEPIPVDPIRDDWLAHKGMVQAAVYLRKQLRDRQLLQEAFSTDPARGTHEYDLTIVGHSLGAGTAAILAILLQQEHPGIHCYAFSPPGGLLSAPATEHTKGFITSVVVGKDVVPRIGLYQLEALRQDLINVIKKSERHKWSIISGGFCCCPARADPDANSPEVAAMYERVRVERETRYFTHPTDSAIALTSHVPLYPPGNIMHVVRTHPTTNGLCSGEEPVYQAVWASNMHFDEVLISPTMINDHMPDNVLEALNKVLTNARPAKPSRRYTEAERQAMLAEEKPDRRIDLSNRCNHSDPCAHAGHDDKDVEVEVEEQIIPETRRFLDTSFPDTDYPDNAPALLSNDLNFSSNAHPYLSSDLSIPGNETDPENRSGLAYCIPTRTGLDHLTWDFAPGNVTYRIEPETRVLRPRSFPPKPKPGLRLDLQQSIEWPHHGTVLHAAGNHTPLAPLATPETLSAASSITSVNSRGSWRGGVFTRLSSEVSTLAPIQQSPVRPRAQVPSVSSDTPPVFLTPEVRTPQLSARLDGQLDPGHDTAPSGESAQENGYPLCQCSPDVTPIAAPLLNGQRDPQETNTQPEAQTSVLMDEDYLRHSPDSTTQLPYDLIKGAYSHGGRGYPHGCHGYQDSCHDYPDSYENGYQEPDQDTVASHTCRNGEEEKTVYANEPSGGDHNMSESKDIKSPNLEKQEASKENGIGHSVAEHDASHGGPVKCNSVSAVKELYCKCNGLRLIDPHQLDKCTCVSPNVSKVNGFDQNGSPGKNGLNQGVCKCDCKAMSAPKVLVQNELPGEQQGLPHVQVQSCDQLPSRDKLELPNPFMSQDDTQDTSPDQSQSPLLTRANLQSHDKLQDNQSQDHLASRDHREQSCDVRDDVSCSDSEPFMPQHPDSDSQASPLYPLLNGLFIQESQV